MKIALVTTSYPSDKVPFAGRFVFAQAQWLQQYGHDVTVFAAVPPGAALEAQAFVQKVAIPSSLFRDGAPDTIERSSAAYLAAGIFTARLGFALATRARNFDAIIAHWLVPSGLCAASFTPRAAVLPPLVICHGSDIRLAQRMGVLGQAMRSLLRSHAKLVFVSEELRQIAREHVAAITRTQFEASSMVQPMGIDVQPRKPLAMSVPWRLLVVARLVPVKGVALAIRALAFVDNPCHLTIAGEGPERANLEKLATDLVRQHPRHQVTLLGPVTADERDRLFANHHMAIVPSQVLANGRGEGTPLVALEALAAGVPLIHSGIGGLASLPGYRFGGHQPSQIRNQVTDLARDLARAVSECGRAGAAMTEPGSTRPASSAEVWQRIHDFWSV